jgi:hypothetical protein
LLIKKQEVIRFHPNPRGAAGFSERGEALNFWRRDGKDFEAFTLQARTRFIRGHCLDRARHDFARRRSQTTNKFSHIRTGVYHATISRWDWREWSVPKNSGVRVDTSEDVTTIHENTLKDTS